MPFLTYTMITGTSSLSSGQALRSGIYTLLTENLDVPQISTKKK